MHRGYLGCFRTHAVSEDAGHKRDLPKRLKGVQVGAFGMSRLGKQEPPRSCYFFADARGRRLKDASLGRGGTPPQASHEEISKSAKHLINSIRWDAELCWCTLASATEIRNQCLISSQNVVSEE